MDEKIRAGLYNKYNHRCAYCGREISYPDMCIDTFGFDKGLISSSNANPCCKDCKDFKKDCPVESFRGRLRCISKKIKNRSELSPNQQKMADIYQLNGRKPQGFFFERYEKYMQLLDKFLVYDYTNINSETRYMLRRIMRYSEKLGVIVPKEVTEAYHMFVDDRYDNMDGNLSIDEILDVLQDIPEDDVESLETVIENAANKPSEKSADLYAILSDESDLGFFMETPMDIWAEKRKRKVNENRIGILKSYLNRLSDIKLRISKICAVKKNLEDDFFTEEVHIGTTGHKQEKAKMSDREATEILVNMSFSDHVEIGEHEKDALRVAILSLMQ